MQKKSINLLILIGMFAITSCQVSSRLGYHEKQNPSTGLSLGAIITKPMFADLEVSLKKSSEKASFDFKEGPKDIDYVKNEAIMALLETEQGDVIVEPSYSITIEQGYVTVKVSGYVARYKNFTPIDKIDTSVLKKMKTLGSLNLNNTNVVSASTASSGIQKQLPINATKVKSKGACIAAGAGVGGLVFLVVFMQLLKIASGA
jgi:hypothetical protein